jgi:hypothetical protein
MGEHSIGFKKKDKDKTHSFLDKNCAATFLLGVIALYTTTNDMQKMWL